MTCEDIVGKTVRFLGNMGWPSAVREGLNANRHSLEQKVSR